MGDVINFPDNDSPEEPCFQCQCGCQEFQLLPKAKIECVECGEEQDGFFWGMFYDPEL